METFVMTLVSTGRYQHIECSECSEERPEFRQSEFFAMLEDCKAAHWTIEQDDDGTWQHICTTCKPYKTPSQRAQRLLGL